MAITLISASFLGLLLIHLSYAVSKQRMRTKTDIGDGGDKELQRVIRAHGNFIEYVPMGLLLIGLLEMAELQKELLIGLAVMFVVGRYMHGLTFGKIEGRNRYRFWGTIFTWLTILIASILGLLKGYGAI